MADEVLTEYDRLVRRMIEAGAVVAKNPVAAGLARRFARTGDRIAYRDLIEMVGHAEANHAIVWASGEVEAEARRG